MQQGDVGVSFFFLLSGFVLMWSYRREDSSFRFWGRRFGRVYPLHWLIWLVWIVLGFLGVLRGTAAVPALADFLLVQAWIPDIRYFSGVNPPTWSLACEVFFYACFPWIAIRLAKATPRGAWIVAGVSCWLAVVLPFAYMALDGPVDGNFLSYYFPPTRMVEFVLGASLAVLVGCGRLRRVPLGWALVLATFSYLIAGFVPRILGNVAITVVPLALVLVAAAGADLEGRRSLWRSAPLRHLGQVSFAVYLVQYGVIEVLRPPSIEGAESLGAGLGLCAAAIAITIGLSEVLHFAFERPVERRLRDRFPRSDHLSLATS